MANALFIRTEYGYSPTELAGSPWNREWLHGGAPAGLLAHAFEQFQQNDLLVEKDRETNWAPAKLMLDLVRPVPMASLSVSVTPIRVGKRMVLLRGELTAKHEVVAVATLLLVSAKPRPETIDEDAGCRFAAPDTVADTSFQGALFGNRWEMPPGLHSVVKIKALEGMNGKGQGRAWMALPFPIVAGTELTAFEKTATLSDFGNGVGQLMLSRNRGLINMDLILHLQRLPVGPWLGLASQTGSIRMGVGIVNTSLYDIRGSVGQVTQTVMPSA